jgi:hypothetical protein
MDTWTAGGMVVVLIVVIVSIMASKRKIDKQVDEDE